MALNHAHHGGAGPIAEAVSNGAAEENNFCKGCSSGGEAGLLKKPSTSQETASCARTTSQCAKGFQEREKRKGPEEKSQTERRT